MADDEEGGEETREEDGRVVEVDGGSCLTRGWEMHHPITQDDG